MHYVLDTHVMVWFLAGDPALSVRARDLCASPGSILLIPAITVLEACNMLARGRASLTEQEYLSGIESDPRITFLPLSYSTARLAATLTDLPEIHDRLIVASAVEAQRQFPDVALVTKDARIHSTQHVKVLW